MFLKIAIQAFETGYFPIKIFLTKKTCMPFKAKIEVEANRFRMQIICVLFTFKNCILYISLVVKFICFLNS